MRELMGIGKNNLGTTLDTVFWGESHLDIVFYEWEDTNQKLYIGKTDFKNLDPRIHYDGMYDDLRKYLIDKSILDKEYTDDNQSWSKSVWLTDCFLKNGKFDHPICSHWNPRLGLIQIHPGSSRMNIIDLFNPTLKVETFYFSTFGHTEDWLSDFQVVTLEDIIKKMNSKVGLDIGISADHGTFIPHITVNGGQTGPMGAVWHEKNKKTLSSRRIYINKELKELDIFKKDSKENSDLIITIKDNDLDIKDILRLCNLIFLDYDYEDNKIKVVCKNPKIIK